MRRYKSASGHGIMIGTSTKKQLTLLYSQKTVVNESELEIMAYLLMRKNPHNYEVSSKIMEVIEALKLVRRMYKKIRMIVIFIIVKYGVIMMAHFKWIWKECERSDPTFIYLIYPDGPKKLERGRLPLEISELIWLYNTNQRTKVIS